MPTVAIPIRVRRHTVGALNFCKADENDSWTADEMTLLETLTEQLGNALESAQLYQDTQQRAAREQLTSQVTARMRETLNVDTVLQTAVREMRQVLGLHDITIRLEDTDGDSTERLRQAEQSKPDEEVLS